MRAASLLAALAVAQAVAFAASLGLPGLGVEGWHHLASLGSVLAGSALCWRPLTRSRRFLAFGVLAFSLLATASGFWLLYWKEGIRAAGQQDGGVWWHVLWSWAAAVFFALHTWINRVALGHFARRSVATLRGAALHLGAYVALLALAVLTWSEVGKGWFTVENYVPLSLSAWLAVTLPLYLPWAAAASPTARAWWARHLPGGRARRLVDLALVPLAALVVISGVVVTFWDPWLDANGWKYVSKAWHTLPSVAFAVVVVVHTAQLWRTVRAHWRKAGGGRAAVADTGPS